MSGRSAVDLRLRRPRRILVVIASFSLFFSLFVRSQSFVIIINFLVEVGEEEEEGENICFSSFSEAFVGWDKVSESFPSFLFVREK